MSDKYEKIVRNILELAEVEIGGNAPDAIVVHKREFFSRVVRAGSLGAGESYTAGWWDCEQLDVALTKIFLLDYERIQRVFGRRYKMFVYIRNLLTFLMNIQTKKKALVVGKRHYDIGNQLYQLMLDPFMQYTCAYWPHSESLAEAQLNKLDLICNKLGLQPGMTLIDIGCGWGGLMKYAAEKYNVSCVGITISKEQAELAKARCLGLDVQVKLQDYRDITGKYDRVVSIGMLEHVGWRNYKRYMCIVRKLMRDNNSLFLLQTIGNNISVKSGDPWINKYIFPNGMIPSIKQISTAAEGVLTMEDWHSFGPNYDMTLMSWHKNFVENWHLIDSDYSKEFYRMWTFYLLSSAARFRSRASQLWQVIFSRRGTIGGYNSIR